MISKANASLTQKVLGVGGCTVDSRTYVPYASESTTYVISLCFDDWNAQLRYSSKGRSGTTVAFDVWVCLRDSLQREGERPYRDARHNRSN